MFLMLAFVLSQPPSFTVENRCTFTVAVKTTAPTRTVKVVDANWHVHRCVNGHEWSHTDASYGNVSDHTCPACGSVQWQIHQHGTRIVETRTAPAATPVPALVTYTIPQVYGTSSCPGGVCPTPSAPVRGLFGWRR